MSKLILPKSALKKSLSASNFTPLGRSGPGIIVSSAKQDRFFKATVAGAAALDKWLHRRVNLRIRIHWLQPVQWPPEFRWLMLQAIAKVKDKRILVGRRGSTEHKSSFDAVLSAIRAKCGVHALASLKEAACESAALEFPIEALGHAIAQLAKHIKDAGYALPEKKKLLEMTANLARDLQGVPSTDPHRTAELHLKHLQRGQAFEEGVRVPRLVRYRQDWYLFGGSGWDRLDDKDVESRLVAWLQGAGKGHVTITKRYTADVLHNLSGLCSPFPSTMDQPLWVDDDGSVVPSPYIAAQNCLMDMRLVLAGEATPVVRPLSPRHFSTVRLGVKYDATAKCPKFKKSLREILKPVGDGDHRIDVLQEFAGSLLDGGKLRLEKFLVMYGQGSNGKSVLLTLLKEVLGAPNVSSIPLQELSHEFRLAEIVGKLANITNEMPRVESFEEGIVKQLVSGDPVQINRKYRDPFTAVVLAKLMFATNFLPPVADRSDGYFRRVIPMPFLRQFQGDADDTTLLSNLREELPGIANWMIAGLARLARNRRFTACKVCDSALRDYKLLSDPVLQFLGECCRLDAGATESVGDLYRRYTKWCDENGRKPMNKTNFTREMTSKDGISERRPGKRNTVRQRMLQGVELLESHADY